jgi:membrane protein required for colicin V production
LQEVVKYKHYLFNFDKNYPVDFSKKLLSGSRMSIYLCHPIIAHIPRYEHCAVISAKKTMPIDILFLVAVVYGFWQGGRNGVVTTVFNVAAYLFGITLAFKITPTTTSLLEAMFHSTNPMMFVGAFVVNILIVVLIMRMAASGVERVLKVSHLGIINHALGATMMAAFYLLICSIVVWFMVKAQFLNPQTIAESRTYTILEPLPGNAYDLAVRMKPFAEETWATYMTWMDRLQKYGDEKSKKMGTENIKRYKPPETGIEQDPNADRIPPPRNNTVPEEADGIEY